MIRTFFVGLAPATLMSTRNLLAIGPAHATPAPTRHPLTPPRHRRRFPTRTTGQSVSEYALIIGLIAIIALPIVQQLMGICMNYYVRVLVNAAGGSM